MQKIFFFGLGFTSTFIANSLLLRGCQVAGCVREPSKRDLLCKNGINAVCFDDTSLLTSTIRDSSHIIVSVPPSPSGDPVIETYGLLLRELKPHYIGYLSSTVVYGDHGGKWVDESYPCKPASARGAHRLATEARWQELAKDWRGYCDVFRLAGIYGPHRNALTNLQAGIARKVFKNGQIFSRIHQHDIAQIAIKAMQQPSSSIYNCSDDLPTHPWEVIAYAEKLLGLPISPTIPIENAKLSAMAQSFYNDNKRVCNRRIKEMLGIELIYPTYKEGLNALFAENAY